MISAWIRIRPEGTSSEMVNGARRNDPIWPVGGASAMTMSHRSSRTSQIALPTVMISRIPGAVVARASKARASGPNLVRPLMLS